MENQGRRQQIQPAGDGHRRQLVLFPLPLQGHINPMLQLAEILHTKGFRITIIHTQFNSPNYSNYPHFTFRPISDGVSETKGSSLDIKNVIQLTTHLNTSLVEPFRDCLSRVLSSEEPVACVITDAMWYFTQDVADNFKLPRIVLRTSSLSSFLVFAAFPILREKGYIYLSDKEAAVPEFSTLKVKDIPKIITSNPEAAHELLDHMIEGVRASSGVIWNSFKELEQHAQATICQDFHIQSFLIGPFHKYFLASSSSLLAQDRSSIAWLDTQAPNSVLYVSFGSIANTEEAEFLEIAMGLAKSMQPFLWVVRPGLVHGSEWLELLPDGFLDELGGRGHIVQWAPQQEVLAHPATGGFWTHSGWNSTLESICEGVPMICSPSFGDQPVNARYVSDVWKVGVYLENRLDSDEIASAIRGVMVEKELGEDVRKRIMSLREKVDLCLKKGGSSFESLESLVHYILSFKSFTAA